MCAAFRYLRSVRGVDAKRIGFVGASYSAEAMVACAREYEYGRAYVALSPGSFSEESMDSIDRRGIPWLFVESAQERSGVMQDFLAVSRRRSRTAQTVEVGGTGHATDILPGI